MALFQTTVVTDLNQPLTTFQLGNALFTGDAGANRIVVDVRNKGDKVSLSGTIECNVIKSDGTTSTITGGILQSGQAYVDLTSAAYSVPGPIRITIRNIVNSTRTVIAACQAFVQEG